MNFQVGHALTEKISCINLLLCLKFKISVIKCTNINISDWLFNKKYSNSVVWIIMLVWVSEQYIVSAVIIYTISELAL